MAEPLKIPGVPDDLIDMQTAAAMMGVQYRTMVRWVEVGDVPSWRLGRRAIRVSRADVVQLLRPVQR